MPLGAKIGAGRIAEIYTWGDGQILKLYQPGFPRTVIEREALIARAAHQTGINTPAVGEIHTINGRVGVVYTRIDGDILLAHIRRQPWRVRAFGRQMAQLHAAIHSVPLDITAHALPSQRGWLRERIVRSVQGRAQDRLLVHLDNLPDGTCLCHGDFHAENIIMAPSGAVIIDWMNGVFGHPLADVARASLMMQIGMPPDASTFMRLMITLLRDQLHHSYINHYCRLTGTSRREIDRWMPVVAAARITEHIPGEETTLRRMVQQMA